MAIPRMLHGFFICKFNNKRLSYPLVSTYFAQGDDLAEQRLSCSLGPRRIYGSIGDSGICRSGDCFAEAGTCAFERHRRCGNNEESWQAAEGRRRGCPNRRSTREEGYKEKEEESPHPRRPKAHCRSGQAPLGSTKKSRSLKAG